MASVKYKTGMVKSLITLLSVLFLVACSDKTDSDLQGKWQMQTVEANGSIQPVDTIFYNFQNGLFQYQLVNKAGEPGRSSFGYKTIKDDNQLLLELEDPSILPFTDWTEKERTFKIEKSSVKQLILESDGKRYSFRKF